MWQQLQADLDPSTFAVVAVAQESGGAATARKWIEQASPTYTCLIDADSRVSALYGLVNVPQCVWIDQAGRIVRPPEVAGSTDHFRRMDPATRTLSPQDLAERQAARVAYLDAVRDWARTGRYALPEDAVRARLPAITEAMAQADANFRLGLWLRRNGKPDAAEPYLREAARLHPDSWTIFRQSIPVNEAGLAAGPEFWDRVNALGERSYYAPPDLLDTKSGTGQKWAQQRGRQDAWTT